MIYTGSVSLQYLPVSLFTVFKNLTIILIATGERKMFKSEITPLMWLSFGMIVQQRASPVGEAEILIFMVGWCR